MTDHQTAPTSETDHRVPATDHDDPLHNALEAARQAVPAAGASPSVPDQAELAALHEAHETLRFTLDRAERNG